MRSRTVVALIAGSLAVFLLAGPGVAGAQVPDPVDEARQERDEAAAVLDDASARRAAAAAASRRADGLLEQVGDDLGGAVNWYVSVNTDLEDVTYRIARMTDEITEREAQVRDLRRSAREYVAAAYMAGGVDPSAVFFSVETYAQLVTTRTVLGRTSEVSLGIADDLAAGRRELARLHADLDGDQALLAQLNEDAARAVVALDELFIDASADASTASGRLDAARQAVADAEATYHAAVRRLDEEIAKRRLRTAGVEKWRPLVELYFPPDQVWQALQVMACESSGVATATHHLSGAAGLFQFMPGTWGFASAEAGFAGFSPYDPEANVASAAWLVDYSIRTGHPWGPWGRWSCRTVLY